MKAAFRKWRIRRELRAIARDLQELDDVRAECMLRETYLTKRFNRLSAALLNCDVAARRDGEYMGIGS